MFFSGMRRISRIAWAMTSSATLRVLEYGALNTGTPRSWAASRSTWLVPMQKQPTANRRRELLNISAVRWLRERMPTMWASATALASSASGRDFR
jgi:hypothetical protein